MVFWHLACFGRMRGAIETQTANQSTGAYTVTVSGTQNVSSIRVDEGSPTLATGTINFSDATPSLNVATGSTLTFSTALTSTSGDLTVGDLGTAYLGTQGDPWDAQQDMALAALGSVLSMAVLAMRAGRVRAD